MGSVGKRTTLHDLPLPDPPLVPRGGNTRVLFSSATYPPLPRLSRGRCRATPDGWGQSGRARRCTTDPSLTLPSCRGEGTPASFFQAQPIRPFPGPAGEGVGQRPTDGVGSGRERRCTTDPSLTLPSCRGEGIPAPYFQTLPHPPLPRLSRGRCRATPDGWGRSGKALRCTADPSLTLPSCRGEGMPAFFQAQPIRSFPGSTQAGGLPIRHDERIFRQARSRTVPRRLPCIQGAATTGRLLRTEWGRLPCVVG
jgi:hypothetical protein